MTCEAQLPPQRNLVLWEQVNGDKLVEGCVWGGWTGDRGQDFLTFVILIRFSVLISTLSPKEILSTQLFPIPNNADKEGGH